VDYFIAVAPDANGVALRADQDTTRRRALLVRTDGRWRAVQLDWAGAPRPPAENGAASK